VSCLLHNCPYPPMSRATMSGRASWTSSMIAQLTGPTPQRVPSDRLAAPNFCTYR